MLLYPTIQELTKGGINRFQLVIAAAKGARKVTDEYLKQRSDVETAVDNGMVGVKHITQYSSNEQALSVAIQKINSGEYKIVDHSETDKST